MKSFDDRSARWARTLSMLVLVLMTVASAAGLVLPDLYQGSAEVAAMLRGYDLVTLGLAVPLLAWALLLADRGSAAAQLVWIGVLVYAIYDYSIYVFGTAFNAAFLVHAALLSAAISALVLTLRNLDADAIAARFRPRTPVRLVSVLLMLITLGLSGMWIFYSLRFAVYGTAPAESELILPSSGIHLGYALDLVVLVPANVIAAVLLWRRAPWGYVLAPAMLTYGLVYQVNYTVALLFQANEGIEAAPGYDPAEPVILGVFAIATAAMFACLRPARRRRTSHRGSARGIEA